MGPDGLEVRMTIPKTCLNGQCINVLPTGNVYYRDRIPISITRPIVSPDGYVKADDFAWLLGQVMHAPRFTARRTQF